MNRKIFIALALMLNAFFAWAAESGPPAVGERAVDEPSVPSGCVSMFQILDAARRLHR